MQNHWSVPKLAYAEVATVKILKNCKIQGDIPLKLRTRDLGDFTSMFVFGTERTNGLMIARELCRLHVKTKICNILFMQNVLSLSTDTNEFNKITFA